MIKVFCDVDGVIYNINKLAVECSNIEFGRNYDYKNNKSWWWTDTGIGESYFRQLLTRDSFFRDGEPIEGSVEGINRLKELGCDIYFITAPEWRSKTFMKDRIWFLKKYFKWFDEDKHLVLTTNKSLLDDKERILIDDSCNNLENWKGAKICFEQPYNESYKGIRTNDWSLIEELVMA